MCPTIRRTIHIDDLIRVRHDVPQVGVRSGELGVVQSRWFAPDQAFEIEFHAGALGLPLRVILYADDIEPADDAEPGDDAPPARG